MAKPEKGQGKPASPARANKRYEDEASAFERLSEGVESARAARQAEEREEAEGRGSVERGESPQPTADS